MAVKETDPTDRKPELRGVHVAAVHAVLGVPLNKDGTRGESLLTPEEYERIKADPEAWEQFLESHARATAARAGVTVRRGKEIGRS